MNHSVNPTVFLSLPPSLCLPVGFLVGCATWPFRANKAKPWGTGAGMYLDSDSSPYPKAYCLFSYNSLDPFSGNVPS